MIQIFWNDHEAFLSLNNLYRTLHLEPELTDQLIDEYLERVVPKGDFKVSIYPRILRTEKNKSLSHPWVQSFLGEHLEVSLVEHSNGRMQFLSPLRVLQRDGGLKKTKQEAIGNIRNLLSQVDVTTMYPTIWRICHHEVLTSSILLCLDEMEQLLKADVVQFAVPNRGTLYFSIGLLQTVEHLIQQDFERGAYPITPQIYQTKLKQIYGFRTSWEGH